MNVVLLAWCAPSAAYLNALCDAGAAPALLVTSPADARSSGPLCAVAASRGVTTITCDDVHASAPLARIAAAMPDLVVVAGWPHKLHVHLRALARIGIVNIHPSLLPRRRGREPLFWALVRGDPEVGVTIHHLTDAIDAGPILLQSAIAVPPRATSASLAHDVALAGASLVPELVALARSGALPAGEVQDDTAATHGPPVRAEHGLLDWCATADTLDRLVRACSGETDAYTFFRGMRVVVLEAAPVAADGGAPAGGAHAGGATMHSSPPLTGAMRAPLAAGEVVACDEQGLVVAAGDGAITIQRLRFLDREYDAPALAALLGIPLGARFSSNPAL